MLAGGNLTRSGGQPAASVSFVERRCRRPGAGSASVCAYSHASSWSGGEPCERQERLRERLPRQRPGCRCSRRPSRPGTRPRGSPSSARIAALSSRPGVEDGAVDAVRDVERLEAGSRCISRSPNRLIAIGRTFSCANVGEHGRRERVVVDRAPTPPTRELVGPLVGPQHPRVAERDHLVGLEVLDVGAEVRVAPGVVGRVVGDRARLELHPLDAVVARRRRARGPAPTSRGTNRAACSP